MYLGIHPREMRANIEEIAAFTELGPYLDMPVRTYSSGMMVRLSFAASTAIAPEILLMDEWLSAGDASFLTKAQKRIEHFVGTSSILVLASHSIPLLKQWCNRAILLDRGTIVAVRQRQRRGRKLQGTHRCGARDRITARGHDEAVVRPGDRDLKSGDGSSITSRRISKP